jgi:O-antigen/teichoic acid export membrane protein
MFSIIKNVSKHTLIYGVGDMLAKGIGFLLIPLYTHYLSTEQYGTLELLDLTTYVVGLLLAMGIAQSVVRYYYEYEDEKRRGQVISVAMITIWVITLSVLAFLILLSRNISDLVFDSQDYYRFFNIIFVTMVINLSNEIPMTVLRIEQKSVFFVSVSMSRLAVTLTLNIVFIVHFGIMGILVAGLISSSLAGLFLTGYILRRIKLSYSFEIMKAMLGYSAPLIGSWLGMFVLHFGDRFLLQRLDSLDSVGIYALAYKFGMMGNTLILTPFLMTWAPKRFEIVRQDDAKDVFAHIFTYFFLVQLFVSLGIAVLIRDVIGIVAEEAYRSAYQYVPVILVAYIFYGAYSYVQFGVLLEKKTKYLGISAMIIAVVNIVLNYLLIPRLQIWGVTLVTFCSFGLLVGAIYPFAQRFYHIPYQWGRLLHLAATAVGLFFLAGFINPSNLALSLTLKFLIALSFPLVLFVTGFFTAAEKARMLSLWLKVRRKPKDPEILEET